MLLSELVERLKRTYSSRGKENNTFILNALYVNDNRTFGTLDLLDCNFELSFIKQINYESESVSLSSTKYYDTIIDTYGMMFNRGEATLIKLHLTNLYIKEFNRLVDSLMTRDRYQQVVKTTYDNNEKDKFQLSVEVENRIIKKYLKKIEATKSVYSNEFELFKDDLTFIKHVEERCQITDD